VDNPRKVTDINVDGTVTRLRTAKEADIERVILASGNINYVVATTHFHVNSGQNGRRRKI
jgi:hypothetical protein